ncbi:MAG: LysR family transcriptional regulator [Deltaproteobacteria bacterium]|nr:LysR family transcriptional regulator [Deltaproteobacteria bacterium]
MVPNALLPSLNVFLTVARFRGFTAAARELGVSPSAVSQSVKQLEGALRVVLFTRTTRSVALTDAGRRLVERAGPALGQLDAALQDVSAQPGELVGRVKLSVPRSALGLFTPVLPGFRVRHPRVEVEVVVEERLVDLIGEGYDAGVRLSESIERDMVQVRLTESFRFLIVGAPRYLARRGRPQRPEDLLQHDCIGLRSQTTGALYAWELERGRRTWRIPVRGGVIANDSALRLTLAERGVGLAYVPELGAAELIQKGKLEIVLEDYAPTVPGFFLYFPSRAQSSPALRAFVDAAKELARAN